jgi:hypothetical protein
MRKTRKMPRDARLIVISYNSFFARMYFDWRIVYSRKGNFAYAVA